MGYENCGRKTAYEEYQFKPLIQKSYNWLFRNFHKLKDDKKVYVTIELMKRAMPSPDKQNNVIVNNYVQIYRPEQYTREDVEAASRSADRSV
jgi:hypothetical protein